MLTPTNEQADLIRKATDWYYNGSDQVFQFAGKPGRGKTFVLHKIIESIGLKQDEIAPMSYMGCASLVMRTKGLSTAKTIHSWLYTPVMGYEHNKEGSLILDSYHNKPIPELQFEPKPLENIKLIIIDEAGTTPDSMKYDIESRGIKIIVCGDLDQLPPVIGKSAYLTSGKVHMLTEPLRQAADSPILYIAERAINGLPIHTGYYGNCLVIYEDELTDEMVKLSDIILCGKNTTRDLVNNNMRYNILNIKTDIPAIGEKLICRKNNWGEEVDGINLTNGLIGTVINHPGIDGFDGKTFNIDFKPDILDTYFPDIKCDYNYFIAPYKQKRFIKNNKFSIGNKFEFAYAITTHLSQGSQFYNGIYLEEYLSKEIQRNLNYTAVTRFSNSLIYVKKRRKFF